MAFTKITPADTTGKGVIGLPDTPELSSTDMQEKFDELALDVIVPKFNNLVDEITDAFVEEGGDIADVAQALTDEVARAQGAEGDLSDAITTLDGAVMKKATYDSDNDGVVDNSELLNGHADSYFATAQSVSDLTTTVNGKMTRSTYDADNDGVVDNAEALGGHGASYFATTSALSDEISRAQTAEGGKVDKVNGKGLSTNDYTDADKAIVSGVTSALSGKVDKEAGKGLSSNDFTTSYKNQIGTNTSNIGDLSSLVTTEKDNLVVAINEAASAGGASDLDDLTDVTISNPADGQVLKYNSASSKWENGAGGGGGASTLSDLTDTAIANPSEGQALIYSSVGKWTNVALPSVSVYTTVGIVVEAGETSCTVTNDNIGTSSLIEVFTENVSNTKLDAPTVSVSGNTATLTFDALTENTQFFLRITNFASAGKNVTVVNEGDYTGTDFTVLMQIGSSAMNPPTLVGYSFEGYYTDSSCTTAFTGNITTSTDTLYANWEATGPSVVMTAAGVITIGGLTSTKNYNGNPSSIVISSGVDSNSITDGSYTMDSSGWSSQDGGTIIVTLGSDFMQYYGGKLTTVTVTLTDSSSISDTVTLNS